MPSGASSASHLSPPSSIAQLEWGERRVNGVRGGGVNGVRGGGMESERRVDGEWEEGGWRVRGGVDGE
jgi:hypothetical protein